MNDEPPMTLLVVDDTEGNRYALSRILTAAGMRVLEEGDGAGALRRAREADLVVLDVNLPDIKGTEVCRRIKAELGERAPLVLQISASFTRSEDRVEGLDAGADGYLVQPVSPIELVAQVRALIRLRRTETSLRRANRELARMSLRLRRSNEDLESFAYVVAHDLQEPLRMVSMFVNLLEQRYGPQLDERARGYIAHATGGATRMQALIRGVMQLAQVNRGELDLQPFPLDEALDDALGNLKVRVAESGARIARDPLPTVTADRSLISQVFQNLLANAIKFHGSQPDIRISAEPDQDGWRVSVADRGPGIEPQQHTRVFELFHRLDPEHAGGGIGVGLALVKKIVERHGGDVGIRSQPGEGATFHFWLPGGGAA